MKTFSSLFLYAASFGLFVSLALLQTSWTGDRPYVAGEMFHLDSITILNPCVGSTLFYSSCLTAGLLLVLGLMGLRRSVVCFPAVALLLAVIVFPYVVLHHAVTNFGSWTMHGRTSDSVGDSYVFCDTHFLQGQIMALARVDEENSWLTRLKVLGANNGDSPRSWASVVRPASPRDEYGQLYLTRSNMLVGIRNDNKCYLAYDIGAKQFIGHGDIEHVSPFICVDADDDLHGDDIRSIEMVLSESTLGRAGYPLKESLEVELDNPNPIVQRAAECLLRLHDEENGG